MEACTIPISDGEGDDDMSGEEARQAQLVKRERSPSPDADRELERRLAAHAAGAEVEPVWLSRFESRVGSQLVNLTEAVTSSQGNLQNIDRRLTAVESQPHRDPRVDTLLVQMEELQRNLAAQAGGSREVRPAMPMQQRGPSLDAHPEVDCSHIIFGGWHIDTPRGQIDQDAWTFVRTWQQEHSRHVERLVVYGRRARTAHVYMKESAVEEARNRFTKFEIPTTSGFVATLGLSFGLVLQKAWLGDRKTGPQSMQRTSWLSFFVKGKICFPRWIPIGRDRSSGSRTGGWRPEP